MITTIKITDRISYIKASEQPLSSDVGIIYGDAYTWLFDVGCNLENVTFFEQDAKPKRIILSHFHLDHSSNCKHISFDKLYLGKDSTKYVENGSVVEAQTQIQDGVTLKIIPLSCSHAKGSLIAVVNDEYAFLGDAIYPGVKGGKYGYNQQFLQQEIAQLEALNCTYVLLSHNKKFIHKKSSIIRYLKNIYQKRDKNQPFIEVTKENCAVEALAMMQQCDEDLLGENVWRKI